ncbi:FAD-binding oxidoreductase [Aspergillus aculeatinus CBS 121060]|uniref:Oxidoreductase n=1 Tax=Aspergillus aculeatinus CBS 121060 TaxID=1448322 RepID=A0ACD1H6Q7_9EURO|nr:putative oxidoreductase [Aspergillus aculeatinus CBS 121060]RAH69245.1 putative oxidoreductase [Aspergillus aculeatinus CBS 121060]
MVVATSVLCCLELRGLLGANKTFSSGSAAYNASLASYFSLQESDISPACIVAPTTTTEVSAVVRYLTSENNTCSGRDFAIRSGGHGVFAGAANIADGVTIDLSGLDSISVSQDGSTVTVGVGATWGAVYAALEPLNLIVPGGRDAPVGVGGLSVGGGMSYFSPRVGWTCDNIVDYEVVLDGGSVVHATASANADLLVALRGGSNNFGVVTHVQLTTVSQNHTIWGGRSYYTVDTIDAQLQATAAFTEADSYDEYASLIVSFAWTPSTGAMIANNMEYTKSGQVAVPAAFAGFSDIPSLSDSRGVTTVSELATEGGALSPNGYRELWIETTYYSTLSMLNVTWQQWNSSLADSGIEQVSGLVWSLSLQPLPPAIYARHNMANSLGLTADRTDTSASLMIALLSVTWENEEDDAVVSKVAHEMIAGIEQAAQQAGAYHPFKYLNYANADQDPIASYGPASVAQLRQVARRVDPRGVFQDRVPGGFKLKDV